MIGLQLEAKIANTCDGSGSATAARENLTKAAVALAGRAADVGLVANVAALYRDALFGMARSVLKDEFEALDGHGPSLEPGAGHIGAPKPRRAGR